MTAGFPPTFVGSDDTSVAFEGIKSFDPSARMARTFAFAPQVDHGTYVERGDEGEVGIGRPDMVPAAEQYPTPHLTPILREPAAVVPEVVNARGWQEQRCGVAHSSMLSR